jgi:hypothetical protein
LRDHLERAVIVAVVAMRMMQVTFDQVVGVVAVRHGLVAAAGAMPMVRVMAAAAVVRRAADGIALAYGNHMLVDMAFVRVMKMTVMEIVEMALVPHGNMAAARTVRVRVVGMNGMIL